MCHSRGPARPLRSMVALLCAASTLVTGCGLLRLHDPGRLKTVSEARATAADVSGNAGAVFGPMEDNLDAVRDTQRTLRDLSNKHRFETFKATLTEQSAQDLAREVTAALEARTDTISLVETGAADAARAVNEALDRQKRIADASKETVSDKSSLDDTLKRLKARLDWLDKVFAGLDSIGELAGGAGLADAGPAVATAAGTVPPDLLAKAEKALDGVDKDPNVVAATKLLKDAVQEIAASEQTRVVEMKRHVAEIARLAREFRERDRIAICTLVPKIPGELLPALPKRTTTNEVDKDTEAFEQAVTKLAKLEVGGTARYPCLALFKDPPEKWEMPQRQAVADDWKGGTLAKFVAADLKRNGLSATSPRLVAALGVLLFHEREYFETVRWDFAREAHRHSIRLSKVNAQERSQLVSQLAQSLEVYYQGGIKPEEVAQLALLAAQVGALIFIGVQQ